MATHLQFITVVMIALLTSICISRSNADAAMDSSSTDFPFLDSPIVLSPSPSPPPSYLHAQELQSPMSVLESILSNLGFQEFAVAVPSLSDSAYYTWNGPSTVFAPTDDSIRSCSGSSCSVPQLLREHIVPGIFTFDYLKKLAFGTKLETMSTGKCITVTSARSRDANGTIMYIGGVEITRPDFFNNGLVVVHRLEGFISPLSPFSCNIERLNSVSFPPPQSENQTTTQSLNPPTSSAIMRLMLKDAMLRLHNNGFSVLSLALRVKYPEIVNLQNMTVFALDDASIFSGGHGYLSNFRFHIVPNRMLLNADLMRLQTGTSLSTLERGESLMVTTAGNGGAQMRINYVRMKTTDVVYNLKIAVHSIFLPFPHLHPAAVEFGRTGGTGGAVFDATADVAGGRGTAVSDAAAADVTSSVAGDSDIFKSSDNAENVAGTTASCADSENDQGCGAPPARKHHKDTL